MKTPIKLPEVWGVGVSFRSRGGALTLSSEWDRVQYSTLLDRLTRDVFRVQTEPEDIRVEDANEFRLGGEYAFLGVSPVVAVRALRARSNARLEPLPLLR